MSFETMSMEHEHEAFEKEKSWKDQDAMIQQILQEGMQAYVTELEDAEQAFETSEHTLCCIDEGVPAGDMRSAGSGILLVGADRAAFIEELKKAGVKEVTSHVGCGAAALYREQRGLTDQTVDDVAMEGARRMAEELGVPYKGHINQLRRPKEFHHARVVYVDGTGVFNPDSVKGLPQGFVVSEAYMTSTQAASEVGLAASIALGDHGFGKKFTNESPLLVVLVGDEFSDELVGELQKTLRDKPIKMEVWKRPVKQEVELPKAA
ncbi:hypothetical protein HZA85_03415 [Candidatus Uhrbacteria bacterium]|nr:hypothetical protein [Candidatus Uhrbacteria bacterium]